MHDSEPKGHENKRSTDEADLINGSISERERRNECVGLVLRLLSPCNVHARESRLQHKLNASIIAVGAAGVRWLHSRHNLNVI